MNLPTRPASCDEWQQRISDALDESVPSPDEALAAHVAACPDCGAFQRVLFALEGQLVAQAEVVTLPLDSKARLLARAAALPRLTPAECAVRRAQWERDHLAAIAALERRFLVPHGRQAFRVLSISAGLVLAAALTPSAIPVLADLAGSFLKAEGFSRLELLALVCVLGALAWWKRRSVPVLRGRWAVR